MPKIDGHAPHIKYAPQNRYARHADAYIEAGWCVTAVHGKTSPYAGTTGYRGEVTPELDAEMRRSSFHDNVAIRHDDITLSIDVDEGGGKHGATTLESLELALGDLPPTFSSTARGQGDPRRQLFFRKPEDATLITTLTPGLMIAGVKMETGDIELPQRRHRYSVVSPSVHPDTGETYTWYDLDGEPMDGPPRVEDLPMLPDAWVAALAERAVTAAGGGTSRGRQTLDQLLADSPARGAGRMNDWLKLVAGHYAARHRNDQATYERLTREAAAKVDPDYEDTETVIASIWKTDTRNHPARTPNRSTVSGTEERVTLDDSRLAEFVAGKLGGLWCWAGGRGWLRYDGNRWVDCTEVAVTEVVRVILKEQHYVEHALEVEAGGEGLGKRLGALATLLNRGKVGAVVSFLKGLLERDPGQFDAQPDLLNVANGVIDLRTGALQEHDPELLFTRITPVAYMPGTTHPDWAKTLKAFADEEAADWMQLRFGQATTGHPTSDDVLPFLQGGGANGKSTLMNGITAALGSHESGGYVTDVPEKLLLSQPSDHPTELTTLMGARVAVIEELPEGGRLSIKRLKAVLGTARITARKIRQDNVTWEATHSLFVTTNYRPRVNESDYGTWRRLALVRFPWRYTSEPQAPTDRPTDDGLRDRMRHAREGQNEAVLAWLIEGAQRWYAAGRVLPRSPRSVRRDTDEWRESADHVLSYFREHLVIDPASAVLTTELYEHFTSWLDSHGQAAWGDQLFTERFGSHEATAGEGVAKTTRLRIPKAGVSRPPGVRTTLPERGFLWRGVAYRHEPAEAAPEAEETVW
nr:phage/plasmid primase, P4 family [Microbacterium barkeri]